MENINVISSYINEIPNKLLTHEEELDLARRYKNDNDQEAFKELIIHNLSLVVNLAKKYTKLTSLPLEDVIQSGNLGLIKAAEKFNPELGFRFTTYAYRWILQSIQYNIKKDQRTIKVPIYLQDLEIKINKLVYNSVLREEKITEAEIAETLGVTEKRVQRVFNADFTAVTIEDIEDFVDEENDLEDGVIKKLLGGYIKEILPKYLSEKEMYVVYARFFGEQFSYDEIGKILGLTKTRVQQIEKKALAKLRQSKELKDLL
jgi:RNA polymerase primary sigma factor